jgi:hypothetical protein
MPRAANLDTNDAMVEGVRVFVWARRVPSAKMPMEAQTEVLSTTWQRPRHTYTDLQTKLEDVSTCSVLTVAGLLHCWPDDGSKDQKHANGKAPYIFLLFSPNH